MRSTFYGLEIAKTGLFTAQNAMDLTGHNISNVDTPGYTRQRLATSSVPPSYGNTFIGIDNKSTAGRGVTTINIQQVRNVFLDNQYRNENTKTTYYQSKEQYFEYVESIFNNELDDINSSTGMTKMFSQFYDALFELSEKPESTEMRVNLQQNAITLCETFNYYHDRLLEQQATLNETVLMTVNDLNSIANKIAVLNKQIYGYESTGANANDLRDQRNLLLDELSGLVNIHVFEEDNGQLTVSIGEGETEHVLVRHTTTCEVTVMESTGEDGLLNGSPKYTPVWASSSGDPTYAVVDLGQGALQGFIDIRDGGTKEDIGIPYVVDNLNKIVQKLAKDMNEIHSQGWTFPNAAGSESQTGVNFFHVPQAYETDRFGNLALDDKGNPIPAYEKNADGSDKLDANGNKIPIYDYSKIDASNFRISDAIRTDPFNIATSTVKVDNDADNNQKGNNENVLAMCGLITKTDEAGNPDNIDSIYKSLLTDISIELDSIHNAYKSSSVMLSHLDNQRASISDVSLDEEMTNVIRFGHAYNAASRVISAIDEELDKLINGTGRVGL